MNATKKLKPAITGLMATFLFLILTLTSYASTFTDFNILQTGGGLWREQGYSTARTGNAEITGNIPYLSTNIVTSNLAFGNSFSSAPISNYVGNSMTTTLYKYLAVPNGGYIEIMDMDTNGILYLVEEITTGITPYSNIEALDFNNDQYNDLIYTNGSYIVALYYNSTTLSWSQHDIDIKGTLGQNVGLVKTGIGCQNLSINKYCFFGMYNSVIGQTYIISLNTSDLSIKNYSVGTRLDFVDYAQYSAPAMADWDVDGKLELFFISDANINNAEGISVFETNSSGDIMLERNIDDMTGAFVGNYIYGIILYNLDNVGDTELCTTPQSSNVANKIQCYNGDGSAFGNYTYLTTQTLAGMLVLADINLSNTGKELCLPYKVSAASNEMSISCVNGRTGSLIFAGGGNNVGLYANYINGNSHDASADIDGNGYDELFFGTGIFYMNTTTHLFQNTSSSVYSIGGGWSIGDVNDDTFAEACQMITNSIYCVSSTGTGIGGETNNLPEIWANLGRIPYNPVCLGSIITFTALEDTSASSQFDLPLAPGKSYFNDVSTDTERFYGNCGNGILTLGDYGNASISVECQYNQTGSFYPNLCIIDQANPTLSCILGAANSEQQLVYVIDGVPGVTCNLNELAGGSIIDNTALNTSTLNTSGMIEYATETTLNEFKNTLDLVNNNWKLIMGLIILAIVTVGCAIGLMNTPYGGVITGVAAFTTFIILTAIGFFPVWIIVLVGFLLAIAFAIKAIISGS